MQSGSDTTEPQDVCQRLKTVWKCLLCGNIRRCLTCLCGRSVEGVPSVTQASRMPLRTLLIDNYDSYTYNLFQLIAEVHGGMSSCDCLSRLCTQTSCLSLRPGNTLVFCSVVPEVIHNDQLTWEELSQVLLDGKYDNIVISPGPGTPESPQDIGR